MRCTFSVLNGLIQAICTPQICMSSSVISIVCFDLIFDNLLILQQSNHTQVVYNIIYHLASTDSARKSGKMCTTRVHTALSTYSHSLVSSHVWLLYAHIVQFHHMYGCYIFTLSGFITILTLSGFNKCMIAICSHSLVSSNVWLLYTHIVWFHHYTHIVWFHPMYCCYILTQSGFIKCMVAIYSHCLVSSNV